MTYTATQLRSALIAEHAFFLHDDDELMPVDEYTDYINSLSVEQLIDETCCDDIIPLDVYMSDWLPTAER